MDAVVLGLGPGGEDAAGRFTGQGGTLFRGHGRITAPGQVTVGPGVLRARRDLALRILSRRPGVRRSR